MTDDEWEDLEGGFAAELETDVYSLAVYDRDRAELRLHAATVAVRIGKAQAMAFATVAVAAAKRCLYEAEKATDAICAAQARAEQALQDFHAAMLLAERAAYLAAEASR